MSKANGKRILSVTVRRMIDESPDTSWLGEYSNRPKTEYAIDRAHSEDCESRRPEFFVSPADDSDWCYWNDSAARILERVRTFLENDVIFEEETDEQAVESVWELEKSAGECDCSGGDMGRGELRYFNGPVENYKGESSEDIRKYVRQDYDRMESLNRGDWCFMGMRAEAEVQTGSDVVQRITSGCLWGIESDSGREHLEETQREELAQLKDELVGLGFSRRAVVTAFKNVQEKGD